MVVRITAAVVGCSGSGSGGGRLYEFGQRGGEGE
jgi:hypothetical protein